VTSFSQSPLDPQIRGSAVSDRPTISVCECGRLRLISGAMRIIFGMRYPYPDFTQLNSTSHPLVANTGKDLPRLTTADFDEIWCRDGAYVVRQGRAKYAVEAQGQRSRSNTTKTHIN